MIHTLADAEQRLFYLKEFNSRNLPCYLRTSSSQKGERKLKLFVELNTSFLIQYIQKLLSSAKERTGLQDRVGSLFSHFRRDVAKLHLPNF